MAVQVYESLALPIIFDLPTVINQTVENGGVQLDPRVSNILDNSGMGSTTPNSRSDYLSVDTFTDDFYSQSTLPNLEAAEREYEASRFDTFWSPSELDRSVPSSYNEIQVDQFQQNDDDAGLPDLDDGIAEPQEDRAPSDPTSTSNVAMDIYNDMAEQDRNLSGGITDAVHIGVEDGNMEGPGTSIETSMTTDTGVSIPKPQAQQQQPSQTSTGIKISSELEKSDFPGDIGIDTAVQSSNLQSLNIDMDQSVSPYLPSIPQNLSGRASESGVSQNTDDARSIIDSLYEKLTSLQSTLSNSLQNVTSTYTLLLSTQNEMNSIDNIVYITDTILTPDEKTEKANNRIARLNGVQTILTNTILGAQDPFLLSAATAMLVCAAAMVVALQKWKENVNNNAYLRTIESVLSPTNSFVQLSLEKAMQRYQHADGRVIESYFRIIESYADSNASERDVSKVLKYDYEFTPSHSQFTKRMKQLYNQEIQETLLLQRKSRSALKVHTNLSRYNTDKVISNIKMKESVKQSYSTTRINTDSAQQKYPKIPFGVKTNSRRLNLLETPVATKQRKSVPYVNEYENSKLLFS